MDSTRGGVLFVDEAYSLAKGGQYAAEAASVLLAHLEPGGGAPPTCVCISLTFSHASPFALLICLRSLA